MRASSFRSRFSGSFGFVAAFVVIAVATNVPAQQTKAAKGAPAQGTSLLETLRNALSSPAAQRKARTGEDDPAAHALYDQMVEAMRRAKSLSYVSHYTFATTRHDGGVLIDCTYQAWLRKPNYFRVEVVRNVRSPLERLWSPTVSSVLWIPSPMPPLLPLAVPALSLAEKASGPNGILIGDGNKLWIYWPQGRPPMTMEEAETPEASKRARLTCYMTKCAPLGGHSIGHEVCYIGMSMPVIDPSTFHGYTDSLQQYLDGVKYLGTEKLGDEECDKIEVSIMKHQRSWYLWLSKRDHLPRKLKEIVRVSFDLVITEDWSSVARNAKMPETLFAWKPPEGWTPWKMPEPEEQLLKPGTKAPNFELASANGTPIRMADYRGQFVWLYIWRAG
ncbi:MAG: DUF2092 domain-containing protein [Thermoguttaceae bacterium]